jgi:hypothetical protein
MNAHGPQYIYGIELLSGLICKSETAGQELKSIVDIVSVYQ